MKPSDEKSPNPSAGAGSDHSSVRAVGALRGEPFKLASGNLSPGPAGGQFRNGSFSRPAKLDCAGDQHYQQRAIRFQRSGYGGLQVALLSGPITIIKIK